MERALFILPILNFLCLCSERAPACGLLGAVQPLCESILTDELGGRHSIRLLSGMLAHHGLQSQAMIPLKHGWIKIEDHIY
jgi:hypothetical protein